MSAQRLTREESQALTRARIVEAAREAFAEKGFYGASVEEITERAGFTRGAFYSNFADKDDLFLAVMEAHEALQVEEVSDIIQRAGSPREVLAAIRDRGARRPLDRSWHMLRAEFRLHALRDPELRPRLAARERSERRAYGRAVSAVFKSLGLAPPAAPGQLALILQSLDEWTAHAHAIDPDDVSRSAYFDSLELLFRAAVTLARELSSSRGSSATSSSGRPTRPRRQRKPAR